VIKGDLPMTANPKRFPRKRSKDGSYDAISRASFVAVGHSMSKCGPLEDTQIHICDSAFLAERGIFTRIESGKFQSPSSFGRTSEAA
jgi:hypothetical protein